jgi:hypothetical protein
MKKSILSIFLVLSISFIQAQISINANDFYSANDTIRLSQTAVLTGIDTNLSGANTVWDFSFLTPESQSIDTLMSISATGTTYNLIFNNSTLYPNYVCEYAINKEVFAAPIPGITIEDPYVFYKNKNSHHAIAGLGATISGIKIPIRYTKIDTIYHYPVNYGDKDSCDSYFEVNIPSLATIKEWKTRHNEVDGWGTLITPYGSFQALRVKSILTIKDSVYYNSMPMEFNRREVEYKWLSTNEADFLLQITTRNMGTSSVMYKDSLRQFLSIRPYSIDNSFNVFPNPANDFITISFDNPLAIQSPVFIYIYDINGKLVQEKLVEAKDIQSADYMLPLYNHKVGQYNIIITDLKQFYQVKSIIINH